MSRFSAVFLGTFGAILAAAVVLGAAVLFRKEEGVILAGGVAVVLFYLGAVGIVTRGDHAD